MTPIKSESKTESGQRNSYGGWQVEAQVCDLQPVPAWQEEEELQLVPPLPARKVEV